jgi:NAD(P)H dehydrogenase (quinone)
VILVTGASGKTGRAVCRALAAAGATFSAFAHRAEQRSSLVALGAQAVHAGDLRQPGDLRAAMRGARLVYHICPNVHPDERRLGGHVIAAAHEAGVERIVYHSVLHPQTEAMPHHWQKLRVEAALFESGLDFTILQPAPYMQNTLAAWQSMLEQGAYTTPYATGTRLSLVDLDDLAAAAAVVLTQPGHGGAVYELVGTPPLTQDQVAAAFAEALGRPVQARAEPRDAWERRARAAGLPDYAVAALLAMFDYYERFGLWGSQGVLHWLLGRPPASLPEFAARTANEKLARNPA